VHRYKDSALSTQHITNGDCAADKLRQFLTDPVSITADVLHDGPAPHVDLDTWHTLRAKSLEPAGGDRDAFEERRRGFAAWDRAIVESTQHDEVVLWFEHDLFDQLALIRTLDLLASAVVSGSSRTTSGLTRTRVSLICIDRFPGVDRFIGLGQLTPQQLASLVDTRQPVTDEQYATATKAWNTFRAPDPSELVEFVRRIGLKADTALPFLRDALKRFLEEYPSTANGLSRTADAALSELEAGPRSGLDLFMATQAHEERPFMGDWGFYDLVHQLANARVPLVTIAPPEAQPNSTTHPDRLRAHIITITDAGRDVVAGRKDAVALNGLDVWRGGVHLVAAGGDDRSPWRWDARRETLV